MQARAGLDPPRAAEAPISGVDVGVYRVPTEEPESDGTFTWDSTTLVVATVRGGGQSGLGYTYADTATARLIADALAAAVVGLDVFDVPRIWTAMVHRIRNLGRPGIASMAIAAVDTAVWDLKARLLGVPLARLLGQVRDRVPVYGSGGFTSLTIPRLQDQLHQWTASGIRMVKMKVGRTPEQDVARVRAARDGIGAGAALFVDANGAYSRTQALAMAERFVDAGVSWFEEPVSSDDLEGLHLMRVRAPAGMDITAGEYGYDQPYFRRMLGASAVDVLQVDATRCAGITGFLQAAALCDAYGLPLSAHTAPSLHAHPCCAVPCVRHVEYFHDHARIERMLFDGALAPVDGDLQPDLSRPGMGLDLRDRDAVRYVVS